MSKQRYTFVWVTFGEDGETVDALYKNGARIMWGDYYHDKISETIPAYLKGFRDALADDSLIDVFDLTIPDKAKIAKDMVAYGQSPPESFEKIPLTWRKQCKLMENFDD